MTDARRLLCILFSPMLLIACGDVADEVDLDLARAYGEVLIAEGEYGADTTQWGDEIRSVLAETGFESIDGVRRRIREIAVTNPAVLRLQIDSVQSYLQREKLKPPRMP